MHASIATQVNHHLERCAASPSNLDTDLVPPISFYPPAGGLLTFPAFGPCPLSLPGLLSAEAAPVAPVLPLAGDAASGPNEGTLPSSCSVAASGSCLVEVADAALTPAPGMSMAPAQWLQYNSGHASENTNSEDFLVLTWLVGLHYIGTAQHKSAVTCSSGLCSSRSLYGAPVPMQAGSCRSGRARCLGRLDSRQLPSPRLDGVLSQCC